jgi:hypothetical protein
MASNSPVAFLATVLAAALGFSAVASAQPTTADRDTARALMAEGRAHRDNGDLQGALRAFSGADAIMHVPTTGLEVARTQAALGLLVEARETALGVARMAGRPGEPVPFKVARDAAGVLSGVLDTRIPSLTITVKNVPRGATGAVSVDDVVIPPERAAQPCQVDPGHHVVVARAGEAARVEEIDLVEKDQKEVTLELPDPRAPGAATESGPTTVGAGGGASQPASHGGGVSRALVLGGFGLAGAGLLAGSISGALSLSKTAAIKASSGCAGTVCGPTEYGDIRSARALATLSTASFVVAAAGVVIGIVGLLAGTPSSARDATPETPARPDATTSWLVPYLLPEGAGVRGGF